MPHATTRSAVLDLIRATGTISRVGLISATGLTGATISTVVRRLINDGLVLETGRAESTGGKPRVLLQLNQSSRFAVGVHLDHSGISYVLTNLGGTVVARMSRAGIGVDDPPVVVARMARQVHALIEGVGIERSRVLGLGLVSPGPLTPSSGRQCGTGRTSRSTARSKRPSVCQSCSRTTPPRQQSVSTGPAVSETPRPLLRSSWEPASVPACW